MRWSINWDRYYDWEFRNSHAPYLAALPWGRSLWIADPDCGFALV